MEIKRSQLEWDIHFLKEAELWSRMSKCLSRKVGAVLVKDKYVIATGYNGSPKGLPHCDRREDDGSYCKDCIEFISSVCPRQRMGFASGEGLQWCPAIHAERNVLLQAARMGVSTEGATLYCNCNIVCPDCAKELINAGIKRIVCLGFDEYYESGLKSAELFKMAGVTVDAIDRVKERYISE